MRYPLAILEGYSGYGKKSAKKKKKGGRGKFAACARKGKGKKAAAFRKHMKSCMKKR